MLKVVFCIPTVTKPYQQCLDALEASVPLIEASGYETFIVGNVGSPYISHARATMLRKATEANADIIVFIDHDLSWDPQDLLSLIQAEGDCISGAYRFKYDPEEYMGKLLPGADGKPQVRSDGAVLAHCIPAGFLKLTKGAIARFTYHYPELQYIDNNTLTVDLFNHGAHQGVWYGEDYAFSRRWNEKCGDIYVLPNLNITHHTHEESYRGNLHEYLLRQPGGSHADINGA